MKNPTAQKMCRRVFLQAVDETSVTIHPMQAPMKSLTTTSSITQDQAKTHFRSFFGPNDPVHRSCIDLLNRGAALFAKESYRFADFAREYLNEPDAFSQAIDELLLMDRQTKQAIVAEMQRRRPVGNVVDRGGVAGRVGMFIVPPPVPQQALNARVAHFIREFLATGFHPNGALQIVKALARA